MLSSGIEVQFGCRKEVQVVAIGIEKSLDLKVKNAC